MTTNTEIGAGTSIGVGLVAGIAVGFVLGIMVGQWPAPRSPAGHVKPDVRERCLGGIVYYEYEQQLAQALDGDGRLRQCRN